MVYYIIYGMRSTLKNVFWGYKNMKKLLALLIVLAMVIGITTNVPYVKTIVISDITNGKITQ